MVHEPFVPMTSWRWVLMGLWQRLQLGALRLAADVVFASIEPWTAELEGVAPRSPVHHLPVGSNLPDARARRAEERKRLGAGEATIVVSCLGRRHPSWMGEYAVDAVNAVARAGRPPIFLVLGAEAPRLEGLDPAVEVHAPGYLEADSLAANLAASDIFLAPLIDGVSTRRGSLMAALQHGLAVVGTAGPLTDPVLREAGPALHLAEVGDRDGFSRAAVCLAGDREARVAAAAGALRLYGREFDWPVVAGRLIATLPER
jgi:glycosyltransferase involved in cell wall biosynthesis